jgi:hypothetical protein
VTVPNREIRLSGGDSAIVIKGLTNLFILVTDSASFPGRRSQVNAELRRWRAAATPEAKVVLEMLADQVFREWTKAFAEAEKYPSGPWIYPTVLGNRIAALDDYAEQRYGMDTASMWERMWWILPTKAKQEISDARLVVEVFVNLMTVVFVLVLLWQILLMLLSDADPSSAVRASLKRPNYEVDDGVAHGWQAWLRRWSVDSFFSTSLLRDGDAGGRRKRSLS